MSSLYITLKMHVEHYAYNILQLSDIDSSSEFFKPDLYT